MKDLENLNERDGGALIELTELFNDHFYQRELSHERTTREDSWLLVSTKKCHTLQRQRQHHPFVLLYM